MVAFSWSSSWPTDATAGIIDLNTVKIADHKLHGLDESALDTALSPHDYYVGERDRKMQRGKKKRNSD